MVSAKLSNIGSLSLRLPFVIVILLNHMLITLFLHITLATYVFLYVLIYVDDLFITSSSLLSIAKFKAY